MLRFNFIFYPWFKFHLPSFLGLVMYGNSLKQREIKFKPRIKLNHNNYIIAIKLKYEAQRHNETSAGKPAKL